MSNQRTLEQKRSENAWKYVSEVKKADYQAKYGSVARRAVAYIQINGLGQTLAFWRARGRKNGRRDEKQAHYDHLYTDVSNWVTVQMGLGQDADLLNWIMGSASTDEYRRATTEVIAFLNWVRRFAESELGDEEA